VISAARAPTRTVLVVDDEVGVRESLRVILGRDYRVLTADGGEAALEILRREKISVVTLDLRMPGLGGIETLLEIRGLSPDVGVVLVTAYGTETEAMRALRLDASDLVTKPFDALRVLDTVRRAVERRHANLRSPSWRGIRDKATRSPSAVPFFPVNPEDQFRSEHFSTRDGEIGLLWAIFDDGIQTYCREILRGGTSSFDYREVERWVFRSPADAVTSFSNLCEVFGIDASRMRAALLQLREQPDQRMVERLKRGLG
jgi:DNA-binding response OmpR family regulator